MKRNWVFVLLLTFCSFLGAQNLAPNPSFEIATGCQTGNGWLMVNSWRVPASHGGSPDRFHVCAPGTFGVTSNVFGDQAARTGSSYVGFVTHFGSNGLFREYLQAPLTSALIPGQTYTASAYISLSDGSGWATDGFGFHFAVGAISGSGGSGPLPFTPQAACATNNFMNDKIGWMLVTANFVATSAFTYVTFGNFKSDAATNVQVQASGWAWNYTYLDDISVSPSVVLSAEMGEFEAVIVGTKAKLVWNTISEQATDHYVIERSVGGLQHFEAIGTVAAVGNLTTPAYYQFMDEAFVPTKLNYYRLKEVDQNGIGGYSQTIELHTDALVNELTLQAYPNPIRCGSDLYVNINSTKSQTLSIVLVDLQGKIVHQSSLDVEAGMQSLPISVGMLSQGCYVLKLTGNGIQEFQKLLVTGQE